MADERGRQGLPKVDQITVGNADHSVVAKDVAVGGSVGFSTYDTSAKKLELTNTKKRSKALPKQHTSTLRSPTRFQLEVTSNTVSDFYLSREFSVFYLDIMLSSWDFDLSNVS